MRRLARRCAITLVHRRASAARRACVTFRLDDARGGCPGLGGSVRVDVAVRRRCDPRNRGFSRAGRRRRMTVPHAVLNGSSRGALSAALAGSRRRRRRRRRRTRKPRTAGGVGAASVTQMNSLVAGGCMCVCVFVMFVCVFICVPICAHVLFLLCLFACLFVCQFARSVARCARAHAAHARRHRRSRRRD